MNDEDDDANTLSATKYPCMVSLVALQQMRNRLQLSYLGRKLMKWTAMATGRELRRMAGVLVTTYTPFSESMSNAFLLLARGRYFYPNLNRMVLENVSQAASVKVAITSKAMAGVKLLHYNILESGVEPYEHLGIEKGGQQIHEAKVAWLELLKQVILMLELKIGFMQMETASRNATKKVNVIAKIVIPRTVASVNYIVTELDEMHREDFFRLVKVKKRKLRLKMEEENKKENKEEEKAPPAKKEKEIIMEPDYTEPEIEEPDKESIVKEPIEEPALNDIDLELGVFETKYQKIIKIVRSKQEDGTIMEERKVINRKIESRTLNNNANGESREVTPKASKASKSKSNISSNTVATAIMKHKNPFRSERKTRSETLFYMPAVIYPIVRYSISFSPIASNDNRYDFYCVTLFESQQGTSNISPNETVHKSKSELEIMNTYLPSRSDMSGSSDSFM